jgi:hypothetical protein
MGINHESSRIKPKTRISTNPKPSGRKIQLFVSEICFYSCLHFVFIRGQVSFRYLLVNDPAGALCVNGSCDFAPLRMKQKHFTQRPQRSKER